MRNFHLPGRSPVYGTQAMCATSHPAASHAAMQTLGDGGNAVDAALTASAVLCVVEPHMTGIGGDCFAQIWKPGEGIVALNGAGRAPAAATAEWYRDNGVTEIEGSSPHAVTVPGAIAAWDRLAADHGRLGLERILAPAIRFAEEGFSVASRVAWDWAGLVDKLSEHEGARQHLLRSGKAPAVGDIVRFPALAATLRAIAANGREAFYEGAIAEDMVGELQALGGLHTLEDFAGQAPTYVEPIDVPYGDVALSQLPPSNQGITALIILNILERVRHARTSAALDTTRYHILMEAARLAYAARDAFLADPDMADVPVEHMLSDTFANELAARIDPECRRAALGPVPQPAGSDTVYLTVVDRDGMAVSFINSVYSGFGSGIVTRKSGIALHNRGQGFTLDPGHPNCIAPGKRPKHTLVPAMALRGGEPWLSFGVMGAEFQPMGQVYVLTNIVDHGMDPQEAIDFPRMFFEDGQLGCEDGLPEAIRNELRAMGHDVVRKDEPWGGGQAILIDRERGVLIAGSDPRKDGLALGY